MSALSAEASQNLAVQPLPISVNVQGQSQWGSVLNIDPDVAFKEYSPKEDGNESKLIAFLGMSELSRPRQLWRVAMRIGGSHMVIGARNNSIEDLHQRAVQAETEHPSFYRELLIDIATTMKDSSLYRPLDNRGIMDFIWIMSDNGSNLHIIHPSRKQPLNEGARAYTSQLLSLIAPSNT